MSTDFFVILSYNAITLFFSVFNVVSHLFPLQYLENFHVAWPMLQWYISLDAVCHYLKIKMKYFSSRFF